MPNSVSPQIVKKEYSKRNVIKKWKSVEENALLLLEEQEKDLLKVVDVSKRNVGYDLEEIYNDNTKKFFEVKSVNDFGDSFSMTNNEYIVALEHPKQYYLLIVKQDDVKIEALIIQNPIATLSLEK